MRPGAARLLVVGTPIAGRTRAETERLFHALAEGGKVEMPLLDMFWGAYFGSLSDKFGIRWMFNATISE